MTPRIEHDYLDKIKTCNRGPVEVYTVTVKDINIIKNKKYLFYLFKLRNIYCIYNR